MKHQLTSSARAYLDRIKAGASKTIDLTNMSDWMVQNTRHPDDSSKPWSFKDHEYQKDIVNDDARDLCVQKASQVGLSELQARLLLGLLSILRNRKAIYTMPTTGTMADFVRSRIDPIVEASPVLSETVNDDLDNVKLKQFGSSFAYFLGTFTQKAAISIPAQILINDEINFSDQQTLTTYNSRLGHEEDGGIRRKFSTPTVPGVGISAEFELSSQAYYGVVCDTCHTLVFPDFLEDVIIPGYQDDIKNFTKEDLRNVNYDVDRAMLHCTKCRAPITQSNLCDPDKRNWVHKYQDREKHGYQVDPFSVPTINPVSKTLKYLKDYARYADWVNFKVGLPYADAETSFLPQVITNNTLIPPVVPPAVSPATQDPSQFPNRGRAGNAVMGVDVGKTSHVTVGIPAPDNPRCIHIIYLEEVKQTGENDLLRRVTFLIKWFNVGKAVVDAGPDFTFSMGVVAEFPIERAYANYYSRQMPKNSLDHIKVNESEGMLTTVRTESLDQLAKRVNSGLMKFPKHPLTKTLSEHLSALKTTEVAVS